MLTDAKSSGKINPQCDVIKFVRYTCHFFICGVVSHFLRNM